MTTALNKAASAVRLPSAYADAKAVPQDVRTRRAIRGEAHHVAATLSREQPLAKSELEHLARRALEKLELPERYLGFAMVAVDNAFWRDQFGAVPMDQRLLLLPHCARNRETCKEEYDAIGLLCAGCGGCVLGGLKQEAEALGYKVLIAEGTPAVIQLALSGRADALLGVACMDSLERSFDRVMQLGIPHASVPLLRDGCVNTIFEVDVAREWLHLREAQTPTRTRSYLPLLRSARDLFEDDALPELLAPCVDGQLVPSGPEDEDARPSTDAIALDWVRRGGKRFRPFVTLASYSASVSGHDALDPGADLSGAFPSAVRRVALAIEVLHKASLAHDDVEDGDAYRYGRETLHRRYGLATAVNVGDYLIGLGYRLVSSAQDALGPACVADLLGKLADAHVKLCRGQGNELFLGERDPLDVKPLDVLSVYALKTVPAFEVALYAGVRMADTRQLPADVIRSFCRSVGVAYQILNDLDDWEPDHQNKLVAGQDALAARPTILQAFAVDAGKGAQDRRLLDLIGVQAPDESVVAQLHDLYAERGVFAKAQRLVQKYRSRAVDRADAVEPPVMGDLMRFIVDVLL